MKTENANVILLIPVIVIGGILFFALLSEGAPLIPVLGILILFGMYGWHMKVLTDIRDRLPK